jgi:hypothetical protein
MLDSPHTSLSMLMRGTSLPQQAFHPTDHVQQDIHPTNNQPQSVWKSWAGEARHRVRQQQGGLPSSASQSLCALVMQSSAPAPGAQSPWDSVMGAIEDSISQCTFLQMTNTVENPHADGIATTGARPRFRPPTRPPRHVPHTHDNRMAGRQMSCLSSANGPSTVESQQRCHSRESVLFIGTQFSNLYTAVDTSTSARSPSWPPMPRPRLQQTATARQEKIQLPIAEQDFLVCTSGKNSRFFYNQCGIKTTPMMMMSFICSCRNKWWFFVPFGPHLLTPTHTPTHTLF